MRNFDETLGKLLSVHDPKPDTVPHAPAARNTATEQTWRLSSMSSGHDCRYPGDKQTDFKPGDTAVGTLRKVYGADFALGYSNDARLKTVLDDAGVHTLTQYLDNRK